MLYTSYKTILERGIYYKGSLKDYKTINFTFLLKTFYGLNKIRFFYYFKRFELQLINYKIPTHYKNKHLLFYKIWNHYILQIIPSNYQFISLRNLNIIRKYIIRSYQGYRHKTGKPVHGQRTWSNASTVKYNNTYLRLYLYELKRTQNSTRLTDQWV